MPSIEGIIVFTNQQGDIEMSTPDYVSEFMDEAPVAAGDSLKRLVALADKQVEQATKLEELEVELANAKEAYKKTSEVLIPSLMQEIGMRSFTLASGDVLEVEESVSAYISEANKPAAFDWLRRTGHGGIIKNTVTMTFGSGEDEESKKALELLAENGFATEQKETVHPATLKSFARDQMAALDDDPVNDSVPMPTEDDGFIDDDEVPRIENIPFPKEVFGVHVYEVAKIKKPKVKKTAKKK